MGYSSVVVPVALISSNKEVYIEIPMNEDLIMLDEIVVKSKLNKEAPLNATATVSPRMLSAEEASRYAGGFDDPARITSSFAGVASNLSSNAISIRGKSPQFLQWGLEGIEIPNPTHFPDITGVGGGILTVLNSHVLGNSDFMTGAFPAEYNNALSGIFDVNLRNGNSRNWEHSLQFGTLGVDVTSEEPFSKNYNGSYIISYRYTTMAIVSDIAPDLIGEAGGMRYQDFAFKFNFPTKRMGTFSLWGIGAMDKLRSTPDEDYSTWETDIDPVESNASQRLYAIGLGHKVFFNNTTFF